MITHSSPAAGGDEITVRPPGPRRGTRHEHDRPSLYRLQAASAAVRAYRRCRFSEPYTVRGYTRWSAHEDARVPPDTRHALRREPGGQPGAAAASACPGEVLAAAAAAHRGAAQGPPAQPVIASVLGVVVIGSVALYTTGVMKDDGKKENAGAEVTLERAADQQGPDPCEKAAPGSVKKLSWEEGAGDDDRHVGEVHAEACDDLGDIGVALKTSAAPHTVNSFDFLAGKGYFDHTKCHRLTTQASYVPAVRRPAGHRHGRSRLHAPGREPGGQEPEEQHLPGGHGGDGQHRSGSTPEAASSSSRHAAPPGTIDGRASLTDPAAGENTRGDGAPNATVVIDKATVTKS